jgi:hypothetical protein
MAERFVMHTKKDMIQLIENQNLENSKIQTPYHSLTIASIHYLKKSYNKNILLFALKKHILKNYYQKLSYIK